MWTKIKAFFNIKQHIKQHGFRKVAPLTLLTSAAVAGVILLAQNGNITPQPSPPPTTDSTSAGAPAEPTELFPSEIISTDAQKEPPIPSRPDTKNNLIKINAPAGGKGWVRGRSMQISWIWNLVEPNRGESSFDVNLLKAGKFDRKITSVPIQQNQYYAYYSWQIPADLPIGQDYTVEVIHSQRKGFRDINNKPFSILSGDPVTVSGRFVDKFTAEPFSNMRLFRNALYGEPLEIFTDQNGKFSFPAKTIYDFSKLGNIGGSYGFHPACTLGGAVYAGYFYTAGPLVSGPLAKGPYGDQVYTWNVNSFDAVANLHFTGDSKAYIPILTNKIDLGDIAIRPTADLYMFSDTPVQFRIYWTVGRGSSNAYINYSVTLGPVRSYIPLEYDLDVELKDQAGKIYAAPAHQVSRENRCGKVVLSLLNGQVQWQPYALSISALQGSAIGTVGQPFNLGFSAQGGIAPYTFSIIYGTLPAGLILDQTGVISGTPTTAGVSEIVVKATDSKAASMGQRFPIIIKSP